MSREEFEKREKRRVVRHFQHYAPEQRANHAASYRLGHLKRSALGEYFYTHPDVPGRAFPTRKAALVPAWTARQEVTTT